MSATMPGILASVLAMGLVTLACRAAPFLLFGSGRVPPVLDYLQRYLPPIVMAILVLNAFRTASFSPPLGGLDPILPGLLVAGLQLWKRNVLLSIAVGTALHVALVRFA